MSYLMHLHSPQARYIRPAVLEMMRTHRSTWPPAMQLTSLLAGNARGSYWNTFTAIRTT